MIPIEITEQMVLSASERARRLGVLRNSIRKGSGNIVGFLGEECFKAKFSEAVISNSYNFDLVYKGFRIEVKTKARSVEPRYDYDVSVSMFNDKQLADYYVFVSVMVQSDKYVNGHLLGYVKPKDFFERAIKIKSGDFDSSNGFCAKADCWNMKIGDLSRFKK